VSNDYKPEKTDESLISCSCFRGAKFLAEQGL
jgi:hypothetical protein